MKQFVIFLLSALSKLYLALKKPKVIAITGSVGKSTTKLAIAKVLGVKYKVHYHPGSYNSEFGVPLTLFDLRAPDNAKNPIGWLQLFFKMVAKIFQRPSYEMVVLEMGADQPGDIANLTSYIKPNIGVITAIQPVHTEKMINLETIFEEKSILAHRSQKVVLNGDDQRLRQLATSLDNKPLKTYGFGEDADWQWSDPRFSDLGVSAQLRHGQFTSRIQTKMIGVHSLYALAAAAAVAEELGVSESDIVSQLMKIEPMPGRLQMLRGKKQSQLLDDSYNASPQAVLQAIKTLKELPPRKKIAILGSMNELGELGPQAHKAVGAECVDLDLLVTLGIDAKQYLAPGAIEAGLSSNKVKTFDDPYSAGEFVLEHLNKDTVVLVKGSQNGVFSEEALKVLLADRSDESKLVRQSASWLKKKSQAFNQR